jgi:rhamnosyltransferase
MTAASSGHISDARFVLCIPVLNPGRWADRLVAAIGAQTLKPEKILVIDSSSTDGSVERFAGIGAEIVTIPRERFDHGGTRNMALDLSDAELIMYLTQDSIPADENAFATLIAGLMADDRVGVAYGRQLARPDAAPRVRAHRLFNYPEEPARRTAEDVAHLGMRAAFSSDSWDAYRRSALEDIGRFPARIIGSEDHWAAARLLRHGWEVAYVADARVEHSHDYRPIEDFRRYFDIGVMQSSEPWLIEWVGHAEREGIALVRRQAAALRAAGVRGATARVAARAAVSWLGFRAGRSYKRLPTSVCRWCSMNKGYWDNAPREG